MKVVVIRHGKVDFKWRALSTSRQFDMDCRRYDKAPIKPVSMEIPGKASGKIYISTLPRTRETAVRIFGERDFITTKWIDEVPIHSSVGSKLPLPLSFWNISGRLQWLFQCRCQPERRRDTVCRAQRFVEMILRDGVDCTVVTHGFFMHILIKRLKENGFHIAHTRLKYSNGEYVVAVR